MIANVDEYFSLKLCGSVPVTGSTVGIQLTSHKWWYRKLIQVITYFDTSDFDILNLSTLPKLDSLGLI